MNEEQQGWMIFISALITSCGIGFMIGFMYSLDLTSIMPSQFGFDAPIQGMNETVKIYLENFNQAEYVCKLSN